MGRVDTWAELGLQAVGLPGVVGEGGRDACFRGMGSLKGHHRVFSRSKVGSRPSFGFGELPAVTTSLNFSRI